MDRLILSEIIGLFIGAVLLFTSLFFAAGEIVRVAGFLQGGMGLQVVVMFLLYTLPGVLAFAFPMAMLLATLLGFGRLSGDLEIVALTAIGTRFERIMVPVAAFGIAITAVGLWLNNDLAPYASAQRNVIYDRASKNGGISLLSDEIFPRKFKSGDNQYSIIYADGIENLTRGELRNVTVVQFKDGKPVAYIFAARATWQVGTMNWTLLDFIVTTPPDPTSNRGTTSVIAPAGQTREQKIDTPTQLAYLKTRPEDTSTALLRSRAQFYRNAGNKSDARKAEVEIAKRQSLPWASLMFALIGAPLGVRPQRAGKGVGLGLSVAITFAYHISLQVATILGTNGTLPPTLALWLPNLACLAVGIFLIRRVLR